jgi:hypothetical protein
VLPPSARPEVPKPRVGRTTDASFTKRVGQLAVTDPLLDEDLSDLVEVVEECAALPGR